MRSSTPLAAVLRTFAWIGLLLLVPLSASAEPYLAVESGLTCASCHVNPSGGGKRTPFGMLYARNQIAAQLLGADDQGTAWTGDVSERWLAVGGDFRGGYESVDISALGEESETEVTRATVYAELRLLPQLLKVYLDAKVAPDDADTREAYLLLTPQ
ncbi:MAG TPA: hypothetical protein VLD39_13830, partial [Gammaproteobacteria bacterium]|nr:hypothetical protein [Gammaproteobacteria bacterium]